MVGIGVLFATHANFDQLHGGSVFEYIGKGVQDQDCDCQAGGADCFVAPFLSVVIRNGVLCILVAKERR